MKPDLSRMETTAAAWERTRRTFERLAARSGIRQIAKQIPASHTTVYRLIKRITNQPTKALHAAIERIVTEAQENN